MIDYSEPELLSTVTATDADAAIRDASAIDYCDVPPERAALAVARVLLLSSSSERASIDDYLDDSSAYAALMRRERDANHVAQSTMLTNWLLGADRPISSLHGYYPLYLYNIDFGDTRAIFERFLLKRASLPPYLSLLCLNLFHQVLGISHTQLSFEGEQPEESARRFNRLFGDLQAFEAWITRATSMPLNYYAGATHTILNLYDRYFTSPATGALLLNRDAECAIDLGGGFSTSDISRLVGRAFICADTQHPSPRRHDPEIIFLRMDSRGIRVVDTATHDAHVAAQDKVEFSFCDVFDTPLPDHAKSYIITSTGFLTSTIRPQRKLPLTADINRLASISVSVHGVYRVLELVNAGKDVDLFTVQRSTTRSLLFKTCFLRWSRGKLIKIHVTRDTNHRHRLHFARQFSQPLIHPSNEEYAAFARLR